MSIWGTGFITMINYASRAINPGPIIVEIQLLTESSLDILAENSDLILVEE